MSCASQYQACPGKKAYQYLLNVAGYIRGAMTHKITMKRRMSVVNNIIDLCGYCDSDYAADLDTRRSRTGFVFYLLGNYIGSQSKLQQSVALSTAESEFCSVVLATTFAMWAMQWIVELGFELNKPVIIYSDNKSCIAIARNANINFKYSKHIDVRQMFIREIIAKGDISVLT